MEGVRERVSQGLLTVLGAFCHPGSARMRMGEPRKRVRRRISKNLSDRSVKGRLLKARWSAMGRKNSGLASDMK